MRENTQFKLIVVLILLVGTGLFMYVKKEADHVTLVNNIYIPIMASKSFFMGCVSGSKGDIEFCKQMQEAYKYEILDITKMEE